MTRSLLRATVRTALLAAALAAAPATADVVLTDTMARASRTTEPAADGAQWFSIGPGATTTYAPNELRVTHPTGNGAQLLGYLTPTGAPLSLAPGQSLQVSFTFAFQSELGATTGGTAIRLGLLNSGGVRISEDITTLSSSGSFINTTGYAAMMSPATSGISIRERIPAAGTNQNNLIGTPTNVYTGAIANSPSQPYAANVDYQGVFTAINTGAGLEFTFAVSGGDFSDYQLTATDSTSPVVDFDALAFGWSNGVVTAGGGLTLRNVTVATFDGPPPPPPPPSIAFLTDTMSRADRTAEPDANGAQWFAVGAGSSAAYAPGELRVTHPSGTGSQLVGYLTPTGAPVSLEIGQTLQVAFTFALQDELGTATGGTAVRLGLFNSGGARIGADISTASSSGSFVNYEGYAAMMSPTASGISIRERIPSAGTNQTNLIGTPTNVYTGAIANGPSQPYAANVDYDGVFTATRTATGVEFSLALSGGDFSSYQVSATDTDAPVIDFDTIAFGWSTGVVTSGGGVTLRALTAAVIEEPPPPPTNAFLTDTMSRADRLAPPATDGAQWFAIGNGAEPSYAPNALRVTHPSGTGAQLLGYLTADTAPVSLAVGQSLRVAFTFALQDSLGTANGSTALRMALLNSGGARINADITTASSAGAFIDYAGYAAMFSPATAGISVRERIPSAGTNQTNLIGTITNVYSGALGSGASQPLAANVDYDAAITVSRTATGLEFNFTVAGAGLTDYGITVTDTTAPVVDFDAIAFGWSTGLVGAGGGLTVRSLTAEVFDTPPPPFSETSPLDNPDPGRPFIWVRDSDRTDILAKVAAQPWADNVLTTLRNRTENNIIRHQTERDTLLRELPVNWDAPVPTFKTMLNSTPQSEVRTPAVAKFRLALDAAVLFYLTGEGRYAQCAADILHNVVTTLVPVTPSGSASNGGWIVQNDLLLEARILGTQLPMAYDFIRPYLETHQVYDVSTGGMVDFNYVRAQKMFRTYYELTRDHGSKNSNWSALMSTCMLNNLLALSDPAERAAALQVYLQTGSSRQASLDYDYRYYEEAGNTWPESLQYATDVIAIRSTHLVLLERYDPSLNLFDLYPNYPLSLPRLSYLRYPNDEQISFGDGHRYTDGEPYFEYEVIYQHAKARGRTDLTDFFGAAINRGVTAGEHNRSTLTSYASLGLHNELVQLLWFASEVPEAPVPIELPRTDRLPYAGIALQRNPAPDANPLYGLMGFVGGAGHIHSHASGMSMELYGAGEVLGAKSGRTTYQTTDHENYYRVFASNNTIIVNGASRGQGGWEDIGINTVGLEGMEPAVGAPGVSPRHSFTTSSFLDDRGTLAEATQQRTVGIVRTSATTGYYVDFFRSDSSLPDEYHDYIYRNVGDSVTLATDGTPLALASAPDRFASDIGDAYQQPGWRYFTDTEVSDPTPASVTADFSANLPVGETHMQMFMPGAAGREYARVASPRIVDAPAPYNNRTAPALVIRQNGSAWDQPFAAVFEPYLGPTGSGSVTHVSQLEQAGIVVGLEVHSTVDGRELVQYVLSNPNPTDSYTDATTGVSFTGRYAVVTNHGDGSGSLYLGEGTTLALGANSVTSANGSVTSAYIDFALGENPVVNATSLVVVTTQPTVELPAAISVTYGDVISTTVSTTGQPAPVLALASTLPPGLTFNAATGELSGTAAAAGSYAIDFVATSTAGTANGTLAVSVAPAPAQVSLSELVQTYNGQALAPTATTVPAGLAVSLTYGGAAPVDAGSYPVSATVVDPNYVGSTSAVFEIQPALASIEFAELDQSYDGSPRIPSVTTVPAELAVELSYDGTPDAPVYPGTFAVEATVTDPNYLGAATATLTVSTTAVVVEELKVQGGVDGSVQLLLTDEADDDENCRDGRGRSHRRHDDVTLSGRAWLAGDLLVPGTPEVETSGRALLGAIVDGPGAAEPADYEVRLHGHATVRTVVRRIDPTPLPTLAPLVAPTGTERVTLSRPASTPIEFSTVRDLTVTGRAGQVAVPAGAYRKLKSSSDAGFVLGTAGSTTPAVYDLDELSVDGRSQLTIAGPVVLRLADELKIDSRSQLITQPGALTIEALGGEVVLDDCGVVYATIVAPHAKVVLRGNTELRGRVIAEKLEIYSDAVLTDPLLQP